ncbi:MAG: phenylalanine--tRNA ligase subunit beta [bacterium]|nr:phenylalanine--tRNA ligase subunit beta [bacterium]
MINLEWVSDYIDISDLTPKELAEKVTESDINVEKIITNHIDNLVIGEVVECTNHPDSDHLHICKVNVGKETLQIVCGAPNVRVGLKAIVALPGTILPGDFEIKKSKIRGVESNGMLCALYELGLEEKNDATYSKGIYEGATNLKVGEDALKALDLESTVLELDIHKHRNNDCYYHIGFAYALGSILNRKVTLPDISFKEVNDNVKDHFNLEVATPKCSYYLAKMVKNIEIKESPEFIKKRLISAGMRSINNVVDISNYVMLEFGQPLHFFDYDSLGSKVLVRDAVNNEEITTLDNKERILTSNDIVITDGTTPKCIAGVMGGVDTEVTDNTKTILIESAIFDAVSIRNTAARLNLRSEASIRYGKGLNYEYTEMAIKRACHLLEKYANATVLAGTVKYDNVDKTEKVVTFKASEVNNLLGIEIDEADMEKEMDRLGFAYTLKDEVFTVTIPNRRLDIEPNVNDIAEEIVRLYGYHNLTATLPVVPIKKGEYKGDIKYRKFISKRLRMLGLTETKTYTLVSPSMAELFDYEQKEKVVLPNPMSVDKSVVRTTIIPSLINIYNYNKARKVEDIFLYEISKTYDKNYQEESKIAGLLKGNIVKSSWNGNIKCDFYVVKGIVEDILNSLGFTNRYAFVPAKLPNLHPGVSANILLDGEMLGIIGRVHPNTLKDEVYVFELSLNKLMRKVKPIKFKEPAKYPSIQKDVAFLIDRNINASEIEKMIKKSSSRLLKDISVFDVYLGDNIASDKKSIAFKLTYLDEAKTLTDEEVMNDFHQMIEKVTKEFNCEIRDN